MSDSSTDVPLFPVQVGPGRAKRQKAIEGSVLLQANYKEHGQVTFL